MGEVVGAGLLAHVPTIMLPEHVRKELNEGQEISLVPGLHKLRKDKFETLDYDTVIVMDSHWATTVEFVVTAQDRRAGLFTSEELPRGMTRIPYDYPGDPELARAAAEGEDVNAKNAEGDDALHLAALYGRVNRARALLARGADALGRDENGGSALHDASASGHVEIVRALCESASASGKLKELISMVDDDGETPLHLAARGEHRDVVEYLLESGATKDARSLAGETPHDASEDADVRALLEI